MTSSHNRRTFRRHAAGMKMLMNLSKKHNSIENRSNENGE